MQFCDLANKAGRYSKMNQSLSGLSAIAELLVSLKIIWQKIFNIPTDFYHNFIFKIKANI